MSGMLSVNGSQVKCEWIHNREIERWLIYICIAYVCIPLCICIPSLSERRVS
jgi:hypothetical protein